METSSSRRSLYYELKGDVLNIINVLETYLWFTFSPRKQTRCDLVITQRGEVNFKFVNFAPPALLFGIIFLTLHC